MKQFFRLFPIFAGLLILPGCVTQYKKRSLTYLQQTSINYKETKNNLTLEIRKLNKSQTQSLFDGQGKYLLGINTQLLHLKIINNNNITYFLSGNNIGLNAIDNEKIQAALCKDKSSIYGVAGYGALCTGLLIYGAIDSSKYIHIPIQATFFTLFVLLTPTMIVATICNSYKVAQAIKEYNIDLKEDFAEKTISESLKIPADTVQEFLFFADATQFKDNFDITFTEKISQKPLTFNVTL